MGYTTEFVGHFDVTPPLKEAHRKYLEKFSETRRMKRNIALLPADPVAEEAGLLPSEEGEYYVGGKGFAGQDRDDSIVDYNNPPDSQPSLWNHWTSSKDGTKIEWDGGEKFYYYVEWIKYIVDNFMKRWSYELNGSAQWFGDDRDDMGKIEIKNNELTILHGCVEYKMR